ncbi:MAG: hypothetical protein BYD32DRAFT_406181 [Podila humilis]|nr:MAG: hypothetical protein BYD32DRAFT_406181 [Podila humilis]
MSDFMEVHYKYGSRRGRTGHRLCGTDRRSALIYVCPDEARKVGEARLTIHEIKLKAHPPNVASHGPGGKYLSLIYVHPTIVKTPREGWDGDDLWDAEPETGPIVVKSSRVATYLEHAKICA